MQTINEVTNRAIVWYKLRSERGVTAIEYGLLAALIAVVIIGAVTTLGTNLTAVFAKISGKVHG